MPRTLGKEPRPPMRRVVGPGWLSTGQTTKAARGTPIGTPSLVVFWLDGGRVQLQHRPLTALTRSIGPDDACATRTPSPRVTGRCSCRSITLMTLRMVRTPSTPSLTGRWWATPRCRWGRSRRSCRLQTGLQAPGQGLDLGLRGGYRTPDQIGEAR